MNVEAGLYTLKFHLMDHADDDLERFEFLVFLDSLLFVRFKVHIKQAYKNHLSDATPVWWKQLLVGIPGDKRV